MYSFQQQENIYLSEIIVLLLAERCSLKCEMGLAFSVIVLSNVIFVYDKISVIKVI